MRVRSVGLLAAAVALSLVLAACGDQGSGGTTTVPSFPSTTASSTSPTVTSGPTSSTATTGRPTSSSSTAPTTTLPTTPSTSTAPSCVDSVFSSLNEEQRIGQLFIVGLSDEADPTIPTEAVRRHHFGSLMFVRTTSIGISGVHRVTDAVQALVGEETTGNLGFYVAANQEGGQIQALRGSGFSTIPSALDQGSIDPATLREDADKWGQELVAGGINLNFAPVFDVVPPGTDTDNKPIGALQREFGHDPETVSNHGVAFLEGMRRAGVATTAKHFPGLGRVEGNTDFTAEVIDTVTTVGDPYLRPFQEAVDAGVPMVMVALATYTQIDSQNLAVFSPPVMSLLREGMGFDGVIASDDLGDTAAVEAIPAGERAIDFLAAGGDMIVSKTIEPAVAMVEAIQDRLLDDPSFEARVHQAVMRVLEAKEGSGLLPCSG